MDREGCYLVLGIGGMCDLCCGIDYESKCDFKEYIYVELGCLVLLLRNGGYDIVRNIY